MKKKLNKNATVQKILNKANRTQASIDVDALNKKLAEPNWEEWLTELATEYGTEIIYEK